MTGRGTVLVTGASRGIGAAVAERLTTRGFQVVGWARSDSLHCGRMARVDVGDPEQVDRAVGETLADAPALQGLVLNAGAGVWTALADLAVDEWRDTMRTNLDGAFYVLRATLPRLIAGRGLIVGILSDSARYPFPGRAAYGAAKSGLYALLEAARREVRAAGVRVSLVVPSRVDTYFRGAHAESGPGSRPGALAAADVAGVVATLFELPGGVEVRETHVASVRATYGPYPEAVPV
jgi:NAD(P)-dependent dehydrogenase (short-subunit alcohol dehydrogenase family)